MNGSFGGTLTIPSVLLGTVFVLISWLSVPVADAAPVTEADVLFHANLDGSLELFLPAQQGSIRASFSRAGPAYTPGFVRAERNQPRSVTGRFGQAIYLEAGDYGNYPRGTRNNLPPASSRAGGFPGGFTLTGGARGSLAGDGLTGRAAIRVEAAAGGGIETKPASLTTAMRYVASVYLRSEQAAAKARLVVEDLTNGVTAETPLTLTAGWGRHFVVLPHDERNKKHGDRDLAEPLEVVMRVVSEDGAAFFLDAPMLEQAGVHYSGRQVPSSWIEGGSKRCEDAFTLPLLPETFSPQQGTISFWVQYEPGGVNRTLFSVGGGWSPLLSLGIDQRGFVYSYFGAGRSARVEETAAWRFVAISWEGRTSRVYLDGEEIISVQSERGFGDEDLRGRIIPLAPGNIRGGTLTHLNGAIDEITAFRRPLDGAELRILMARDTALVNPPPVVPIYAMPVRAFSRDMKVAPLRFSMRNTTSEKLERVQTTVAVDGYPATAQAFTVGCGPEGTADIVYPFPVEKLAVGDYRITLVTTVGDATVDSHFNVGVGPHRNPERLPILAWNVGSDSREQVARLGDLGVTIVGAGQQAADWATELGLHSEARLHLSGAARPNVDADRIMGNDGRYGGVNPRSDHVIESVREAARAYAESLTDKDSVRYSIINSEWHLGMDFSPAMQELVREKFGIDLSRWVTEPRQAWNYLHPFDRLRSTVLGAAGSPPGGVVDSAADAFYRFHLWWHKGAANEQVINQICMEEIKRVRPDIQTIIEPILRRPSVKVYGRDTDIAQEWFYFENPRAAVRIQERLAALTRGTAMRASGMPQFLFKAAPFAATPPPDMLREAIWLCGSRPLAMMSFWGWHRVLEQGDMLLIEDIEKKFAGLSTEQVRERRGEIGGEGGGLFIPEVKDAFAEISRTFWEPYGPLLTRWGNVARRVAVVHSFASEVYSNVRWPVGNWLEDALVSSGVPYDVLYDEDFEDTTAVLADYRIVVLPATYAVTAKAHRQLLDFVARGGIVISDEACRVEGIPSERRFGNQDRDDAIRLVREESGVPIRVEAQDVIWNLLTHAGANYLVVVNDKRVSGRYLGQWGSVLDQGVAQPVTIRTRGSLGGRVIDLTGSTLIPTTLEGEWNRFGLELGPTAGRIFMLVDDVPATLDVGVARPAVAPGETIALTISLAGKKGPVKGGVPFQFTIVQPDGAVFDVGGHRLLENGHRELPVVVPLNAAAGTWRLQVRELATGLTAETTWEVTPPRAAADEAVRHGPWRERHATGELKRTGSYEQGREHGRWVSYRRDGTIEMEQMFEHGNIRHEKRFHLNGKVAEEIRYLEGRVLFTVFDQDGQVVGSD